MKNWTPTSFFCKTCEMIGYVPYVFYQNSFDEKIIKMYESVREGGNRLSFAIICSLSHFFNYLFIRNENIIGDILDLMEIIYEDVNKEYLKGLIQNFNSLSIKTMNSYSYSFYRIYLNETNDDYYFKINIHLNLSLLLYIINLEDDELVLELLKLMIRYSTKKRIIKKSIDLTHLFDFDSPEKYLNEYFEEKHTSNIYDILDNISFILRIHKIFRNVKMDSSSELFEILVSRYKFNYEFEYYIDPVSYIELNIDTSTILGFKYESMVLLDPFILCESIQKCIEISVLLEMSTNKYDQFYISSCRSAVYEIMDYIK